MGGEEFTAVYDHTFGVSFCRNFVKTVQAGMFFHVYFVTYNLCDTAVSCKRKSLIKSPILVSLLSEEHAILEGVLSRRSGSPESCTGAGLPLEGNSRQRQNENNKENPSWAPECSYTAWFREYCSSKIWQKAFVLYKHLSGERRRDAGRTARIWCVEGETRWHINKKPHMLDWNRRPKKIMGQKLYE